LLPVALSLSLGPVNVGAAAVGGPGVDLTPVSIFTLDEGPLTSGIDLGGCNLLPPLIAHAMANNSDRPVQVFVDPACTVPFITIPAGDGAHVIGDGSWKYADAPASAGVSTATKAAKSRRVAAVCSQARAAHSTRAKVRRACAKVKRAARATRHA
ncbi:MAG TPA: hypothetical protein VFR49_02925, partial [Solirubrobacteraceae bacterium]|nr:hypothetical protein [Solirubrobacteraceae bacterium]